MHTSPRNLGQVGTKQTLPIRSICCATELLPYCKPKPARGKNGSSFHLFQTNSLSIQVCLTVIHNTRRMVITTILTKSRSSDSLQGVFPRLGKLPSNVHYLRQRYPNKVFEILKLTSNCIKAEGIKILFQIKNKQRKKKRKFQTKKLRNYLSFWDRSIFLCRLHDRVLLSDVTKKERQPDSSANSINEGLVV